MLKRIISLVLSAALAFSAVVFAPADIFAAENYSDLNSTFGVYYTNCRYSRADLPDAVLYSDRPFMKDSKEFDNDLAIMSLEFAVSSNPSMREPETDEGYYNKCRNIKTYLEDNGFVDFDTNGDYRIKMTETTLGVACAHKTITDNGKKYTLLALAPRSAGYEAEWMSNFIISKDADDKGNHAGYQEAADKVLSYAREYIQKYGIKGDIKLWLTGYSRGGGIADITGASILSDSTGSLGNAVRLEPGNFYCYAFGAPRTVIGEGSSFDFSKSAYVHNMYRDSDVMTNLPPEVMGFVRYGDKHDFAADYSAERRERMLQFLKGFNPQFYNDYIEKKDPDAFKNLKIDTKALKQLKLEFVEDPEPYHQVDQAGFLDSMARTMNQVSAKASESGNSREGFYNEYQEPLGKLISFIMDNPEERYLLFDGIKSSKTVIPMAVSLYIMYKTEKNDDIRSSDLNKLLEEPFNQIAYIMEDENGELRNEYKEFRGAYKLLKALFTEDSSASDSSGGVLLTDGSYRRYKLRKGIKYNRLLAGQIRELTGLLFAATLRDGLKNMNADEVVIKQFTSREYRNAASYMLANLALGDVYQSDKVHGFSFDSEEFKHLATFAGNVSSLLTNHYNDVMMSWMKTEDSRYNDMDPSGAAALTGYRRVYIGRPGGKKISGSVRDTNGSAVAVFSGDELLSRTDARIGITKSDNGSWLRLPADRDFKVVYTAASSAKLGLRVADYSYYDGEIIRTVKKDSRYNWSDTAVKKGDQITVKIPAAEQKDGGYDLTSSDYSIDIRSGSDGAVIDKSMPKPKKAKAKADKNAAAVSWKKFKAKQLAKFGSIDIQYSTNKKFTGSAVKSRTVSKKKTSIRIKGLKRNRTYYFRVRTVKKVNGVKKVSAWASAGKVKISG